MVIFKDDTTIYCNVNETVTIPYAIPSNVEEIQIIRCPKTIAVYDISTDTLTPYENVENDEVSVTEVTCVSNYAYIDLEIDTLGTYNINIGGTSQNTQILYKIHVIPTLTNLSMIFYEITDTEELSRLLSGENYTFEANVTVQGDDESKYFDYLKNYRIGICNAEIDDTSHDTLIASLVENAEWSDQPSDLNVPSTLQANFTYDEDQALFVLISGDYFEGYPNEFIVSFDSLKIYETTPNSVGMQCHHVEPLINCISENEYSSISLDDFSTSNTFTFSKFHKPDDDLDDEDITYGNNQHEAVCGIALKLDVLETGDVTLLATLTNDKSSIGQRSIILPSIEEGDTPTTITIGDSDDLWGFDVGDIENIEDWELTLQILNNTSNTNEITFNNVRLEYYTIPVEANQWDYFIEDTNLGYYGVFMEDVDIPTGLNTEVKQLEIEGSDINTITSQNIIGKTITLEFSIYDCNLQTSIKLLNKLARLIYNERDAKTNQPIPKTFRTNLHPEKEWEYVCIKEMETEFVQGEIKGKVELYVPDGTYKTVDEITTGPIGYNQGLNKVQPVIVIGNLSGDEIKIVENNTNQQFVVRDLVYVNEDIITIDCKNRTIIQSNPNRDDEIDLSSNCDMDNDWFTINKVYSFICNNANVLKVTYFERG